MSGMGCEDACFALCCGVLHACFAGICQDLAYTRSSLSPLSMRKAYRKKGITGLRDATKALASHAAGRKMTSATRMGRTMHENESHYWFLVQNSRKPQEKWLSTSQT